jgi:phosphotransferase system enzyme I (PtsP)
MAMGYEMLSMNASNLPKVKSVIRGVTLAWAEELLAEIMQLEDAQVIAATVELALEKVGLGRMIGLGRS